MEKDYDYMLNLIIPCYNLEEYITPCLKSICMQKNNLKDGMRLFLK